MEKGLDRTYRFFVQYGLPMLQDSYAPYLDRMAVGLVGHGSECFGYDDDISRDHDYDTGFCIWLPDDTYDAIGASLQYDYLHLPHTRAQRNAAPDGRGVGRITDFYRAYTGLDGAPTTWQQWLGLDTVMLAEATNGRVFLDNLGAFSTLRTTLLAMPDDIRYQKAAAHLALAAQAGQYNYARCMAHDQPAAAVLTLGQFATHLVDAVCLLCHRYAPYYKWAFRALAQFPLGQAIAPDLEALLVAAHGPATLGQDADTIERICAVVRAYLQAQGLSDAPDDYLLPHAKQLRRHIADPEVRALHLMAGV